MFALPDWTTEKYLLVLALAAIPMLPNLWSIRHAFSRYFPTREEKKLWILVAVFIPVLGGLAYLFVGRKRAQKGQKTSEQPSGQTSDRTPEQTPNP